MTLNWPDDRMVVKLLGSQIAISIDNTGNIKKIHVVGNWGVIMTPGELMRVAFPFMGERKLIVVEAHKDKLVVIGQAGIPMEVEVL